MPDTYNFHMNIGHKPSGDAMKAAEGFTGTAPKRKAPAKRQASNSPQAASSAPPSFPLGVNTSNMIPFAQTPAGQALLQSIMRNVQANSTP